MLPELKNYQEAHLFCLFLKKNNMCTILAVTGCYNHDFFCCNYTVNHAGGKYKMLVDMVNVYLQCTSSITNYC